MNSLLELILKGDFALDALGLFGLGMLGLGAARLRHRENSWGASMMTVGAISLQLGRLHAILSPHVLTDSILGAIGPVGIALTEGLPPLLLSFGLAGVVWGLWGHERWMNRNTSSLHKER